MTQTLSRRGLLRLAPKVAALSALSAIAPAPAVVEKTVEVEAAWASAWPPTAHKGKLCRSKHAPGYYTIKGMPALFYGASYADEQTGVSGFLCESEIDPPEGMHVLEIYVGRDRSIQPRYAVVRHQEG